MDSQRLSTPSSWRLFHLHKISWMKRESLTGPNFQLHMFSLCLKRAALVPTLLTRCSGGDFNKP
ncbi:hypothetical protein PAMP_017812 [Pampus punctatissimus]